MYQLLWGILNLFLVVSFFYFLIGLVIKGRKFLNPYPKIFTVPVLVFGVLGLLNSTTSKEKTFPIYKGFATMEGIEVSENLANTIHLVLVRDMETKKIFYEGSHSNLSGFVMGMDWEHLGVIEKGNITEVSGLFHYRIMGVKVFSDHQSYQIKDINPDLN